MEKFTVLFQKMCILDYVIRNTDRNLSNWLIKFFTFLINFFRYIPNQELNIAAIDNGLAFPIKHPEEGPLFTRHFPFEWASLSLAQKVYIFLY